MNINIYAYMWTCIAEKVMKFYLFTGAAEEE